MSMMEYVTPDEMVVEPKTDVSAMEPLASFSSILMVAELPLVASEISRGASSTTATTAVTLSMASPLTSYNLMPDTTSICSV